jgi:YD repeat-containing protein
LYHYRYDQLNRLVSASSLFSADVLQTNDWSGAENPSNALNTSFSYDPNGNILTLERKGTAANPDMDDLIYHYSGFDNRLQYVTDLVNSVYDTDIDNQNPHNYSYDLIGNLIADEAEEISMINWTVYGKVSKILSYNESKPTIYFKYDASGNRVSKTTIDINGFVTTFYVRDAQGNVLTTYDYRYQQPIMISEQLIYGSSRIGLWDRLRQEISHPETGPAPPDDSPPIDDPGIDPGTDEPVAISFEHVSGLKRYELTNHLGNVLTTVSDRKHYSALNGNTADIISAQDYYPFGSLMPGRKYNAGGV